MGRIVYKPFIMTSQFSNLKDSEISETIPISEYRSYDPDKEFIPITYIPTKSSESKSESKKEETTERLNESRTILTSRTGSHQFKTSDIQVGKMQGFLDVLAKNGIYVRVTSGIRPGATTPSGRSRHDDGHAIDITPLSGETWEGLITKIKNNPEVLNYMVTNDVGWLEEISKEDQKKYNASNANIHVSIAGDRGYGEAVAIRGRKKTFGI